MSLGNRLYRLAQFVEQAARTDRTAHTHKAKLATSYTAQLSQLT
jgi:hypothetical protein